MRFKIFADPGKIDLKDKSKNIFTQLVGFYKGCKSVLLYNHTYNKNKNLLLLNWTIN